MSLSVSSPIYIPMTESPKKNLYSTNTNIYKSASLPEQPNTPDDNFWKTKLLDRIKSYENNNNNNNNNNNSNNELLIY